MVIRIALSSHDSVGLGHVRRNLAIAHALTETLPDLVGEPVTGILITGQSSATAFAAPAGWDWVVQPSVTVAAGGYASRHLAAGIDRVTAMRGAVVAGALRAFGPDLFIADRHPFGVHRELTEALRQLRAHRPSCVTVLGLRDVLDRPRAAKAEWRALGGASAVREYYDAIWAYGDPRVHDITASGELPRGLHPLVSHTGFLAHGRPAAARSQVAEPFVLTTVGGGSDGRSLAEAAARAVVPAGHTHLVVTGPQMPASDHDAILAAAGPATRVIATAPDVPELVRRAAAVVSMGGYNTVCEVMSTATPALVVPRTGRRDEQRIRVAALSRHGAIDALGVEQATPEAIGAFFARRVGDRIPRRALDLDGLAAVGPLAARLLSSARSAKEVAHAV